jgi:hypothetical protein
MSEFEIKCKSKSIYKEISGLFASILKLHDECINLPDNQKDSDIHLFRKQCIELKKMIDSKAKLINNRGNIAMQCNHHYIIDYIDITPDKGQNIKFCTKCFKTCN